MSLVSPVHTSEAILNETTSEALVSVILPVYNGEAFIGEAIESVIAQTYSHWELLVVDDGSTDTTAQAVASFDDRRIHYTYQENQGLGSARNTGISKASGDYLGFVDADDKWAPEFLNETIPVLAGNRSLGLVYVQCHMIDHRSTILPKMIDYIVPPAQAQRQLLKDGFFPPVSVLARTAVVKEVGLFDAGLAGMGAEDWDLWLRITDKYVIQGIPRPLAYYRVYPGSMSTKAAGMLASRLASLEKRYGPLDGDSTAWSIEKRLAYGYTFRRTAIYYFEEGQADKGWELMRHSVTVYPEILTEVDTFYELACGGQPRAYRGQADLLDIEANGARVIDWLGEIFRANTLPASVKHTAYGNAYLALGMLSDQADDWKAARRYLFLAMRHNPRLALTPSVIRRTAKLSAGHRLAKVRR